MVERTKCLRKFKDELAKLHDGNYWPRTMPHKTTIMERLASEARAEARGRGLKTPVLDGWLDGTGDPDVDEVIRELNDAIDRGPSDR